MLSVLFVDDDAASGGDGLSWGSAFDDLQTALDRASILRADGDSGNDVDAIWIAQGVYAPSAELEPGDPRSASFSLVDGVTLCGGFSGTEATLAERDWSAHETVLSGDLGVVNDNSDNAYTVVYCGEGVEAGVDGFLITGGYSNGSGSNRHERRYGGGVFNCSGTLTVANSTLSGNATNGVSTNGGGVFNRSGTLTITACAVLDNTASGNSSGGGGIYNYRGVMTVTNSTIARNSADNDGGGISNDRGTLTLNNSIVAQNTASFGPNIFDNSTVTGSHNLIGDGTGQSALVNGSHGNLVGSAAASIDPMLLPDGRLLSSSPAVDAGDNALLPPGITADLAGVPRIQDGDSDNTATVDMGAYEAMPPYLSISDSSIVEGDSDTANMVFTVTLTDIADHDITFDYATQDGTAEAGIDYTATSGTVTLAAGETAITITVPIHGDMDGELDETFFVTLSSRVGLARPFGVGSIHENDARMVTTSADVVDATDGQVSLREALNDGYPIIAFDPAIYADGPATIALAGSELVVDRDVSVKGPGAELLSIDAGGTSRVFSVQYDVTANISGLAVNGGWASHSGGGIYNDGTLTVTDCTLSGNSANGDYGDGGGIYNSGTLTVANSTFSQNSTNGVCGKGGGIRNAGTLLVTNSTLSKNSSNGICGEGGGIHSSGTATVLNSRLLENSANGDYGGGVGGGIYVSHGSLILTNSMLFGNWVRGSEGGGIYNHDGTLTVTNCTLSGNRTLSGNSETGGGGIYSHSGSLRLDNSIVAQNWGFSRPDVYHYGGTLSGSHNLIGYGKGQTALVNGSDGNLVGGSNGYIDPLFLEDFRLHPDSPAVDAGYNGLLPSEITTDLAGVPRIQDGDSNQMATIDMGAFEAPPRPYLSISDASIIEGDSGTADMAFTVTLTDVGNHAITFDYITQDGTAEAGTDYAPTSGTATIPAGETAVTITVPIYGDVDGELDESFSVTLSSSAGILRPSGVGAILNNDTFVVTTLTDVVDSTDGLLSLREALSQGYEIIAFAPALYAEGPATVTLDGSELSISRDVSIEGPGADLLSINGGSASRVFCIDDDATASIAGLTIIGGSADHGGGILNEGTLTLANMVLSENTSEGAGGGIYNNGMLTVTGSTLLGNAADDDGGGIYSSVGAMLTIANSTFSRNMADDCGGGMYNNKGILSVTSSTLLGNVADSYGGGISSYQGTVTVANTTFSGNLAGRYGGGISNYGTATVTNSTLSENSVNEYNGSGGGIYNYDTLILNNSVLWRNNGGELEDRGSMSLSKNLIGMDPSFVRNPSDGGDGWGDNPYTSEVDESANDDFGDLRPTSRSLAVDYGDSSLSVDAGGTPLATDADGNPRIYGTVVDVGAYEFQGVAPAGREDASLTVTTSEDIVDLYDHQVSLREAIYYAETDSLGTTVTFDNALDGATITLCGVSLRIDKGLTVDASSLSSLTIDANEASRVFTVVADDEAVVELKHLTITGGSAFSGSGVHSSGPLSIIGSTVAGNRGDGYGGGIYADGNLIIQDSTIRDNRAGSGGGVYADNGLTMTGSTVSGNEAAYNGNGGGLLVRGDSLVSSCVISGNEAGEYGGGVYVFGALVLSESTIQNNHADERGGGMYINNPATVTNCSLYANSSSQGGGVYVVRALTMTNCTVVRNLAFGGSGQGGGMFIRGDEASTMLSNTIVAENFASWRAFDVYVYSGTLGGSNNLIGIGEMQSYLVDGIDGNQVGTHESPVDPSLGDPTTLENGTLALPLLLGSPALDTGSNALAVDEAGQPLQNDVAGNARIQGSTVDLGAWEGVPATMPGQVYVVTSLDDRIDPADGELTFVEALTAAEENRPVGEAPAGSSSEQDVVRFEDGVHGTLLLDGQSFVVGGNLRIEGPHADRLFLDGNGESRVFTVFPGGALTLSGLTVTGGKAYRGGGICSFGNLHVTDCAIVDNQTTGGPGAGGGGVIISWGAKTADPVSEKTAKATYESYPYGGAGIFGAGGDITVVRSTISGNGGVDSSDCGGGIYHSQGSLVVESSVISDNASGLAVYCSHGTATLTSSMFVRNDGGLSLSSTPATLTNSLVFRNRGCGLYVSSDVVRMDNTIVAQNCGHELYPNVSAADLRLEGSNNLIGDGTGQTDLIDGLDGNLIGTPESPIDPLLSDLTQLDDGTWEYYLLPGSPALDAGDNALAVDAQGQPLTEDLYGEPRIQGTAVDIGPFEGAREGIPATIYVVTSLVNTIDASDGELTFIEAFEAANRNRPVGDAPAGSFRYQDVIHFADGLTGTVTLAGEPLAVFGDLRIEGPRADSLAIDAAGQSRVFEIRPYVQCDLSGMTVTGGEARFGGAILNDWGDLTLEQCSVTDSSAELAGGGIYNDHGLVIVRETIVSGNTVRERWDGDNEVAGGGGIYNLEGVLQADRCEFSANSAKDAGGIQNFGIAEVTNTVFIGNDGGATGGGIGNAGTLSVTNSVFVGNNASDGGGLFNDSETLTITNTTITGNSSINGGGIFGAASSVTTAHNSIVTLNSARYNEDDVYMDWPWPPHSTATDGVFTGSHNLITLDPLFTRPPSDGGDGWGDDPDTPDVDESLNDDYGDLRLRPDSPAIDAGDNALAIDPDGNPLEFDVYGNVRILDGDEDGVAIVDIGAAEYGHTIPAPVITPAPPQTTPENTTLQFLAQADDPEGPLTYALIGAPAGAGIDPATGEFSWTPTETDGPGEFVFQISATDTMGDTGYVEVAVYVLEVNQDPLLDPIDVIAVRGGETVAFTASAIDADVPAQEVCFSLGGDVPLGATIDPVTGVFSWTTSGVAQDTTFTFDVIATDSAGGTDVKTVSVTVLALSGQVEFVVTSLADVVAEDGVVTLREALAAANTNAPVGDVRGGSEDMPETITFAAELFEGGPAVLSLTGGALRISDDVIIEGPGADFLTVDAHQGSRVCSVAGETVATISGVTLTGGTAGDGGCIYNAGSLTLEDAVLSENTAQRGGAIYNLTGALTLRNTVLSGNSARDGGAICDYRGTITMIGGEFSGNAAERNGGAILTEGSGSLELAGAAVFDNTASINGGGIFNSQADVILTNVVVHGNTAEYNGGGVFNQSGSVVVRQSTIAGNTADGSRAIDSIGGGIYGGNGSVDVFGSVIALNTSDVDSDLSGFAANTRIEDTIVGDTHYRYTDGALDTQTVSLATLFAGDPLTTTDPMVDLRLSAAAAAVNAADPASLPADVYDLDADGVTDEPLPVDFRGALRVQGDALDLGAFESPFSGGTEPLPGDLNGDGTVNTTDLDLIRGNWGSTVTPGDLAAGDASGDGLVGGQDLDIVRANWGAIQAAAADAVLGSFGADAEPPLYGPARRNSAPSGRRGSLSPQQLEMLAREAWEWERAALGRKQKIVG